MKTAILASTALLLPVAALAQGADFQATSRQLIQTYGDSVVGVQGVLAINAKIMGQVAQQQEQEVNSSAAVVSEDGYLIASLSSLDPSESMNGQTIDIGGSKQTLEIEADLSDLKVYLQDGTSYDARSVLRDPQSDLILLKIDDADAADQTWVPVPLAADVATPAMLDEVLMLGRHDASLDRSLIAGQTSIEALVERPRPLFIPHLGAPSQIVFNAAGEVIGLSTQRIAVGGGAGGMGGTLVIQPVSEIQRLIDQAAEAPETGEEPAETGEEAQPAEADEEAAEQPAAEGETPAGEEVPAAPTTEA